MGIELSIEDTDEENYLEGYKFKIILAGDGAVGKTTLINRFISGTFKTDYKATIGVSIVSKHLTLNQQDVSLQIWDIAGQTLFRNFRTKFFSNARGALLVYDLTVPKSLDNLHVWIKDIEEITGRIPYVLIGNKSDLKDYFEDTISSDETEKFKELQEIKNHYYTSALTGENVEQAFSDLVSLMISSNNYSDS